MPETRIIISARDLSSSTFRQVEGRVQRMRGEFSQTNTTMTTLVATAKKAAAALAGMQMVGYARNMVQGYAEFDKGLVGVAKTTNMAGEALEGLGRDIEAMTGRLPVTATELLGVAQAAGQLGVNGRQNILSFTETVGMLGMASDLAGEEAATTLARMLTVTGESMDSVGVLGSVIVALGNNMAATESEIAHMATQVAQATAVFGVSSAEASALGAAMRAMGVRAELGGSTVGRAFRAIDDSLRDGGERLDYLSRLTGLTGDELRRVFATDSVSVFQLFVEGLGRAVSQGQSAADVLSVFGLQGEEVLKVLPTMAKRSTELGRALGIANEEVRNNTALVKEATAASRSHAAKMQIEANKTEILARKTGKDLAPAFETAARAAAEMLGWLDRVGTRLAKNIFMIREMVGGQVGVFDAAMWSPQATDEYIKRLEDGSAALYQAEQELERLKRTPLTIYASDNAALQQSIALQTEKVRVLREWAAEEEKAGQRSGAGIAVSDEDLERQRGRRRQAWMAEHGGPGNNTDLTPPETGAAGTAADSAARLLRQWEEYYRERTLSASAFLSWQLEEEERGFKASDAYLKASLEQRKALLAGFGRYRAARLAEDQERQDRTVREELAAAQQAALTRAPRSEQMRFELERELEAFRLREGYALASDEQRRRLDALYGQWRVDQERAIAEQIGLERDERERPVREVLRGSRAAALAVGLRSGQMRFELEQELAEYRTREGYVLASDEQRRRIDADYSAWKAGQERAITAQLGQESRERLAASDSFMDGMTLAWERYAEQAEGAAAKVSEAFMSLFSNFDEAMGQLTSTGELDMSNMIRSWLADFGRLSSQQLITGPLAALFSGSSASDAGGMVSMLASLFHSGGVVGGSAGGTRAVSPLFFAGARRFHSGGLAGLAPDEVPIIARRGEEVLTERDPRHRRNGSGDAADRGNGREAQAASVRIINTFDPGIVKSYLDSSAGERVILNVIRRNPQMLRS